MYKLVFSGLLLVSFISNAQDKKSLDSVDKVIISQIITPAEQHDPNQEPSWTALTLQIKASYSDVQADRAITKAQIFYYYNKSRPKFCAALVHYTVAYEDKEDLALMNKNANMVLDRSTDPKELATALGWMKHAVDKEPANEKFKTTYNALSAKVGGK
jgi:hypothetical protein